MNCGHGGSRRPATRPPAELIDVGKTSNEASRVSVAASDAPNRGERVPRHAVRRTQFRISSLVTVNEVRAILGTGPGNVARIERFARPSEIPRPSSRETAMPPRWVSGRGGHGRDGLGNLCPGPGQDRRACRADRRPPPRLVQASIRRPVVANRTDPQGRALVAAAWRRAEAH